MPSREADLAARHAVERLDVLEPGPVSRGCNAHWPDGTRCRRKVVRRYGGVFSERRLCSEHARLYAEHDLVLRRIRDIV